MLLVCSFQVAFSCSPAPFCQVCIRVWPVFTVATKVESIAVYTARTCRKMSSGPTVSFNHVITVPFRLHCCHLCLWLQCLASCPCLGNIYANRVIVLCYFLQLACSDYFCSPQWCNCVISSPLAVSCSVCTVSVSLDVLPYNIYIHIWYYSVNMLWFICN